MRNILILPAYAIVAAFVFSIPALAHHGALEYDMQHETTVMGGTVTRFDFKNPHVEIVWETRDDKGATQQWTAETTNPNTLSRYGWNKNSLKPGTELRLVAGNRCKDGGNCMRLRKIVLASGEELAVPQ
jgi:Family of unknown function (DUF6152)